MKYINLSIDCDFSICGFGAAIEIVREQRGAEFVFDLATPWRVFVNPACVPTNLETFHILQQSYNNLWKIFPDWGFKGDEWCVDFGYGICVGSKGS